MEKRDAATSEQDTDIDMEALKSLQEALNAKDFDAIDTALSTMQALPMPLKARVIVSETG